MKVLLTLGIFGVLVLSVSAFPQPADDAVQFGDEAETKPKIDLRSETKPGGEARAQSPAESSLPAGEVQAQDLAEAPLPAGEDGTEEDEAGNRFFGWGLGNIFGGGGGWGNYGGYYGGRRHHHHHHGGFGGGGFGGGGFGGGGFGGGHHGGGHHGGGHHGGFGR